MGVKRFKSRFARLFGVTLAAYENPKELEVNINVDSQYIREMHDNNRRLRQQLKGWRKRAERRQKTIEALQALNHERGPWILELIEKADKWDALQHIHAAPWNDPPLRDIKLAR